MSKMILLSTSQIGIEIYITMIVMVLAMIYAIYYMIHIGYTSKKKYGIDSLPSEEQARVKEDMETGYYYSNATLCRDGVLFQGRKLVHYQDIVWIELLRVTYSVALVPVGKEQFRIILHDRWGKHIDVTVTNAKRILPRQNQQIVDATSFVNMLCQNAPWSLLGKQYKNVSFGKKKKMMEENYERIMRERGNSV